jgi:hypothetical protein
MDTIRTSPSGSRMVAASENTRISPFAARTASFWAFSSPGVRYVQHLHPFFS